MKRQKIPSRRTCDVSLLMSTIVDIRPKIVFAYVIFLLCCGILPAGAEEGGSSVTATSGQVIIVTIGKGTVNNIPIHSIKKIIVQPGLMTPNRQGGLSTGTQRMAIVDAEGKMLYSTYFSFPTHKTVPPVPPGNVDDGMPAVIYLEEPEVVLVVPYFPNAESINIYRDDELIPSASKSLSDAKKKMTSQIKQATVNELISPAPAQSGNLNILVMASGYTSSNMTSFQARAKGVSDTILAADPFSRYTSKVHVNIFSNTTDLGCYSGCYNIDRLMCCDSAKVLSTAAGSGYSYDYIIVVHDTATYSGGGYRGVDYKNNSYSSYSMIYDGSWTSNMALHEFGHSFGDLCDEYAYTTEGYTYSECVNCRATCTDWQAYTTACILGCDAKSTTYFRPDNSVMLDLSYANYNQASIKATYSPDGLEERLQYFTSVTSNFVLSISKAGTGSGTVIANSGTISWSGITGTASYSSGTSVTLTASANSGSTFTSWTGCDSTSGNTCTVAMTAAKSVTATFSLIGTSALTIAETGGGSGTVNSSPAGISCGLTCTASFNSGTVITLTATPAAGVTFGGWTGGGCSATGTCSFILNNNATVNADFRYGSFDDEQNNVFAPYIEAIYKSGITVGCGSGDYCPSADVTRNQMAAFLVRSTQVKAGQGTENFTCNRGVDCATETPYFSDVPTTDQFFPYIQKLYELGITVGCRSGAYCASADVTRDQMAAFLVRATQVSAGAQPEGFTCSGNVDCSTTTPYFSDVPSTNSFFKYIQKLKELGITTGCGNGQYCPDEDVTRDQMAAFLARAFLGMK